MQLHGSSIEAILNLVLSLVSLNLLKLFSIFALNLLNFRNYYYLVFNTIIPLFYDTGLVSYKVFIILPYLISSISYCILLELAKLSFKLFIMNPSESLRS
jgi:hypothetical protein